MSMLRDTFRAGSVCRFSESCRLGCACLEPEPRGSELLSPCIRKGDLRARGPDTQRHSGDEDWGRGRVRLLCTWTGDTKALGFLCWGSLLGGTSSSSFCFTALWINGFKEPELWPFYRKLGVNQSGNLVWLWNGCAGSQAGQLWVHWSCPLWRDFGPSSERVWSWECERSDRGVCLTVMCPLYLILLSLKMALSVPTWSLKWMLKISLVSEFASKQM